MTTLDVLNDLAPKEFAIMTTADVMQWVDKQSISKIEGFVGEICNSYSGFSAPSNTTVLDGGVFPAPDEYVKNSLVYCDRILVPDAMLEHGVAVRALSESPGIMYQNTAPAQSRQDFKNALLFYRKYYSAIKAGLVIPSPHRAISQAEVFRKDFLIKKEGGIPSNDLIEKLSAHAVCHPARQQGSSTTLGDGPLSGASRIAIEFEGDPSGIYVPVEIHMNPIATDESTRILTAAEGKCPDKDSLNAWVRDSIRKNVGNRIAAAGRDLCLGQAFDAPVITPSAFGWNIMRELDPRQNENEERLISKIRVPAIESLTIDQVVAGRRDEDAFRRFQRGYRSFFSSATSGSDGNLQAEANDWINDGIDQINQTYRKTRVLTLAGVASGTLTLAADIFSVAFSGVPWASLTLKVFGGTALANNMVKAIDMKSHPAYFLWQMDRTPFKTK